MIISTAGLLMHLSITGFPELSIV